MPHDGGCGCRVSRGLDGFSLDPLTDLLREGAWQLITRAVGAELNTFLAAHASLTDAAGHKRLLRHRHLPKRQVHTVIGAVPPLGQCFSMACRATGGGAPSAGSGTGGRTSEVHLDDPAALAAAGEVNRGVAAVALPVGYFHR